MGYDDKVLPHRPKNPKPKHWTALELVAADLPEPECFLGTILARQTVMLLEGRRGAGKTYVVLHAAAALVFGTSCFGLAARKSRVLLLSQEMGEIAIRGRLMKMFTIQQLNALEDRLTIICRDPDITLATDEGAAYIAGLAAEHKADVVILDALRDVKGPVKENDNDEMGVVMVRLRDAVASKANVAVILIHHFGKPKPDGGESGRGASVIEDVAADIVYIRDPKDGTGKRTGTFDKTRDGSHQDSEFGFEIYDDDETGKVTVAFTFAEAVSEDADIRKAVDLVAGAGGQGASATDVRERLGWEKRTGNRRLSRAVALGLLERFRARPAGLSTNANEWAYRRPGTGILEGQE